MKQSLYDSTESFLLTYFDIKNVTDLREVLTNSNIYDFEIDFNDFERFILLPAIILSFSDLLNESAMQRLILLISNLRVANEIDDLSDSSVTNALEKIDDKEVRLILSEYLHRKNIGLNTNTFVSYALMLEMRYSLIFNFFTSGNKLDFSSNPNGVNSFIVLVSILVFQKMLDDLADLNTDLNDPNKRNTPLGLVNKEEFLLLSELDRKRHLLGSIIPKATSNILSYQKNYLSNFDLIDKKELSRFFSEYIQGISSPIYELNNLLKYTQ